ncbi:MAG: DUF1190 domain-containing protein [Alphaproteobacteria bacterium]|nr:DUF1190 domain-containing protein [Alphaproteobacteria bacterium]MBU1515003.1 DUF1190 domain-containing protein [Alphaproteobacteria bacterium]MBU2095652.1 DUF1190 domain-containing protein [Alphaproteobacteria bacterium]MBU2151044.1 DUF1190 domain-containing protein [Alphaproteobacteria bacterium]MBU2306907.1 DUF1190 domain-containing protein [Alphaproteobacteria bacterium]
MKRTRKLVLTTLMAAGGVSLTACGDAPAAIDQGKTTDAYAYQSLAECKDKGEVPAEACETAAKNAKDDENAEARYADTKTCEDVYGPGQCVPRSSANGTGSFWGPLVAGFVVGRMMDGGWGGRGLYRDWRDGGYYTPNGGRVSTDYSTGRARIGQRGFDAPDVGRGPDKAITRSSVISRGGFGGRMSSRSYASGGKSWGG